MVTVRRSICGSNSSAWRSFLTASCTLPGRCRKNLIGLSSLSGVCLPAGWPRGRILQPADHLLASTQPSSTYLAKDARMDLQAVKRRALSAKRNHEKLRQSPYNYIVIYIACLLRQKWSRRRPSCGVAVSRRQASSGSPLGPTHEPDKHQPARPATSQPAGGPTERPTRHDRRLRVTLERLCTGGSHNGTGRMSLRRGRARCGGGGTRREDPPTCSTVPRSRSRAAL